MLGGPARRLLLSAALASVCALAWAGPAAAQQVQQFGSYFGGNQYPEPTPTPVPGLEEVTQIDASNASSLALDSSGQMWAWGNGQWGELGNGQASDQLSPVHPRFPPGTKIVSIGEARDDSFAIDSTGQLWAWGLNESGSLCLGAKSRRWFAPQRVAGVTDAVAVQGAQNHVLILLADGTVDACGTNLNGQLGVGPGLIETSAPVAIPNLSNVVEISAGVLTSAARTESGAVYTWGDNREGQTGTGSPLLSLFQPTQVALPGPAGEISCGGDATGTGDDSGFDLALVEGRVYGWGNDARGQIGDRGRRTRTTPVATELQFAKVAASGESSVGLTVTGEVFTWGAGNRFALGTGDSVNSMVPVEVAGGASLISSTAQSTLIY
jgi:alpha-tubulin suppressor-like RCC1 family protein